MLKLSQGASFMKMLLAENQIIQNQSDLLAIFKSGIKQTQTLGVEFEKLPINKNSYKAAEFFFKNGMLDFLTKYKEATNFVPCYENDILLGLYSNCGNISLEPGCQLEYSIKPLENILEIEKALKLYNQKTNELGEALGIKFLALGLQPISTYENIKIIPKKRYTFMTNYLKNEASMPFVMMRESAGIQVSIDYASEEDAMLKLSTALKLSPFLSTFFSNSPIRNGKLNGYKSLRNIAWLNTDNKRCGLISKELLKNNPEFSFEQYAKILLDIPMIFQKNKYVGKMTFSEAIKSQQATISDWQTHLSLFFPDVRLKNYIEIRNHDCQMPQVAMAIPALYKGIFYSTEGIKKTQELFKDFNYYDYEFVKHNGPRFGLEFKIKNKNIRNIVEEIFTIAKEGLKEFNLGEEKYLEAAEELLNDNKTPADVIIQNFEGSWNGKIEKLIQYAQIN